MNSQNKSQAQNYNQKVAQQTSNSVFFNDQQQATADHSEIYPFFQQNKKKTDKYLTRIYIIFIFIFLYHYSEDEDYFTRNQQLLTQINKIITEILINEILYINQILLNYIHEMSKHDNRGKTFFQDKTQRHITIISNHKIL